MTNALWARAHTNIALIKYWGKKDAELMLPANDSLSLTLADFYTETRVTFGGAATDTLRLDDHTLTGPALAKAVKVVDQVRSLAHIQSAALIESYNHVPTAAGLASSASGMAALAGAAAKAAGLTLDHRQLSRLARRGSGSATRSIDGGFVRWFAGHDDDSSFAMPVAAAPELLASIRVVAVVFSDQPKSIGSTDGMARTAATSSYFAAWTERADEDLTLLLPALRQGDFRAVGTIAEGNALAMHAATLAARPPFTYFLPSTLALIQQVGQLREHTGIPVFATVDAGPNVKLLTLSPYVTQLQTWLQTQFPTAQVTITQAGPEMSYHQTRKEENTHA
ncbi:MAG: diphosphomevalonate decarboxylase [Schleiferilactobacillus harbinensis]|jgi:diphosphomevalonate decarboxylase|nr:diphosphomevalonate decarboxylase [Schleiferilactobacillus harbinensis]MCI1912273.1 diphosphomevalonate decarboxylase [Schleiferilactobacillus harbinensis]